MQATDRVDGSFRYSMNGSSSHLVPPWLASYLMSRSRGVVLSLNVHQGSWLARVPISTSLRVCFSIGHLEPHGGPARLSEFSFRIPPSCLLASPVASLCRLLSSGMISWICLGPLTPPAPSCLSVRISLIPPRWSGFGPTIIDSSLQTPGIHRRSFLYYAFFLTASIFPAPGRCRPVSKASHRLSEPPEQFD